MQPGTSSDGMKIELTPINGKDESYIWNVYEEAMRAHIEKVWGWNGEWQRKNFKTQIEKCSTFLILYSGKRIGYIQLAQEKEYTFITMIALDPDYRSRNIGPIVIKEIEKQRQGIPIKLLCLKVNDSAYRFYLRNGFKVKNQDDIFYTLVLA